MNVLTSLIVKRDVLTKGLFAEIASNNRFQCLKWHNYGMKKEENPIEIAYELKFDVSESFLSGFSRLHLRETYTYGEEYLKEKRKNSLKN